MASIFDPPEDLPDDDPEVVEGMKRWRELQGADLPELDERRLRSKDDDR